MNTLKPRALVLTGYGINCDYETAEACRQAGFDAIRVHLNDVLLKPSTLFSYKLVVFPGGFSFGDDLGSGVAFAAKIRFSFAENGSRLYDLLFDYLDSGGLILGVCNGFQILVRLGLIPAINGTHGSQQVTLAPNREGYFIDRWVQLKVEKSSHCIFTRGIDSLRLPVRHSEGQLIPKDKEILEQIEHDHHVAVRYVDEKGVPTQRFPFNPNGSQHAIAGLTDSTGRILGLMPHPEAATSPYQYPDWTRTTKDIDENSKQRPYGDGFLIFKNAFEWVK